MHICRYTKIHYRSNFKTLLLSVWEKKITAKYCTYVTLKICYVYNTVLTFLRVLKKMTSKYSIYALFDYRDGRLKRSDELLMINGKSLIGLSHSEAVDVLRNSPKLVQLVVASKVSVDQGIQQSEIGLCTLSDWDTYHLQTSQYALFLRVIFFAWRFPL